MPAILMFFGALFTLASICVFAGAKSAVHEIEALLWLLIAIILFCTAVLRSGQKAAA